MIKICSLKYRDFLDNFYWNTLSNRNYDLSAKNPNVKEEKFLREVEEILEELKQNQEKAKELFAGILKTIR